MSHSQSIILVMPKTSLPHWMATRFGNGDAHPGMVDINVEEERVDLPQNTPSPRKKRARNKKTKSAKAGIQCVTTYKRQSLNDELINATPQAHVAPVAHHNPTQSPKRRMVVMW